MDRLSDTYYRVLDVSKKRKMYKIITSLVFLLLMVKGELDKDCKKNPIYKYLCKMYP